MDNTLEKLGATTDYQRLYTTILLTVFGWLMFILWTTFTSALWHKQRNDAVKYLFIVFMFEYSSYTNLLDDLIITNTLGLVYNLTWGATVFFFLLIKLSQVKRISEIFVVRYSYHYSIISFIFRYIGLKFDQVNEHLRKIESENERKLKPA